MIEQFQVSNKTETKFSNQSSNKVDGRLDGAVRGGTDEKAAKHSERLFVLIDTDGDGKIDYTDFVCAACNRELLLSKDNLEAAFKIFDSNGNG